MCFRVRPYINNVVLGICINSVSGVDCFLPLFCILNQIRQKCECVKISAQMKDRPSDNSEIVLNPRPSQSVKWFPWRMFVNKTNGTSFSSQLYLPICLLFCDCWNIGSYFFLSVRASGSCLGAWILSVHLLRVFSQGVRAQEDDRQIRNKVPGN